MPPNRLAKVRARYRGSRGLENGEKSPSISGSPALGTVGPVLSFQDG